MAKNPEGEGAANENACGSKAKAVARFLVLTLGVFAAVATAVYVTGLLFSGLAATPLPVVLRAESAAVLYTAWVSGGLVLLTKTVGRGRGRLWGRRIAVTVYAIGAVLFFAFLSSRNAPHVAASNCQKYLCWKMAEELGLPRVVFVGEAHLADWGGDLSSEFVGYRVGKRMLRDGACTIARISDHAPIVETRYTNGLVFGKFKAYSPSNGRLRISGEFCWGKRVGTWSYFAEDGHPLAEETIEAHLVERPKWKFTAPGISEEETEYTVAELDKLLNDYMDLLERIALADADEFREEFRE